MSDSENKPAEGMEEAALDFPFAPAPTITHATPQKDELYHHAPLMSAGARNYINYGLSAALALIILSLYLPSGYNYLVFILSLICAFSGLILSPFFIIPKIAPAQPSQLLSDIYLPTYTILIPLFREQNMLEQIKTWIMQLDYPPDKCDIIILLEEIDYETQAAYRALTWPHYVRLLIVPDGHPRTKPRACNYGLHYAKGDYIVIYDAEDFPHPQQLRQAATYMAQAPPEMICVQAPLQIRHPKSGWLQKIFMLEYLVLFTMLFPLMTHFRQAMPLSGTSNHFRTGILRTLYGWDKFNLTEDADLGVRLSRFGYYTHMISYPTIENAPHKFSIWFFQRTRWITGHIQTLCVHLRRPHILWRDLGAIKTITFIGLTLARIISGPAHLSLCIMFLLAPYESYHVLSASIIGWVSIAAYSLYLSTLIICAIQQNKAALLPIIITMPAYWVLLAIPAIYALGHALRGSYHWYKSPHRPHAKKTRIE